MGSPAWESQPGELLIKAMENQDITLTRDVSAVLIPAGVEVQLVSGMSVRVTQALGGSYTVMTPQGLARIAGPDADALGFEVPAENRKASGSPEEVDPDEVWGALKTVYDPEIPVNIVDLGLVYDCRVVKGEDGMTNVSVKMTLTAPGCGMGPAIAEDAKRKVLLVDGVDSAEVELVWEPAWNQDMITEAGKMKLGLI